MEAAAPSKGRPSPRRPQQAGRLPQPPRRREEFAASSKLANAGSKITAPSGAAVVSKTSPRKPQESRSPGAPARQGNASARSLGSAHEAHSSARDPPASGGSSPSEGGRFDEAPRAKAGEDMTTRRDDTKAHQDGNANYKAAGEHHVDAIELARGGEVLLQRINDLNAANTELKRQLELQVKEVSTISEAGLSQQQLLREFERQAEQARQAQSTSIEARVRAEIGEREEKLRAELEEAHEQARLDREDLMARLQQVNGEVRHIQGERDEARERLREYEERLDAVANAPDAQASRTKGLEMEVNLVRARLARETEVKKAAERSSAESRAQQQELKVQLEREAMQVRQLQKVVSEQTELANFRQEICNDLQMRLKDQKTEAERKLRHEKGKVEVVSRLEGILPRHFLMQALS